MHNNFKYASKHNAKNIQGLHTKASLNSLIIMIHISLGGNKNVLLLLRREERRLTVLV